jgi:O-antigen/teichoic acid export membrane protein
MIRDGSFATPDHVVEYPEESQQHTGRKRSRKMLEAGVSALLGKSAVLIVNLISIPIAVRYLGPVQFGIWATITTTLSLLLVLDLGIANTLTNLISEAYALEDRSQAGTYSATAFWLMLAVSAALAILGWAVWPLVNWNHVFHVETLPATDLSRSVAVAYVVFLLGMPAGLATKLLGGYQELRNSNIFAAAGSICSLLGVVLVARFNGGLPMLVGASSGALLVANVVCLLWIWLNHMPWLRPWPASFKFSAAHRLLHTGSEFFLLQLSSLVVFSSDNIVIAHFLGPAEVTPYNVTWRLMNYAAVLQTLIFPAVWPAYAEAYTRGDGVWVRNAFWRLMRLTTATTGVFCIIFLTFGRIIIRQWAGVAAVPTQPLVVTMCVWVMISTIMNNEACLLAATSQIRLQAFLGILAAIVNLGLTIWLVQRIGSVGVILGTVISYILVIIGPQTWKTLQVLKASVAQRDKASELFKIRADFER